MIDPSVCRHENLVDHPTPKWMYEAVGVIRPRLRPWSPGSNRKYKVMRCVDCGLPGEVPT